LRFRPSEACKKAGDPVTPATQAPTAPPFGKPPAETGALAVDPTIVKIAKGKAAKPDAPAPKPDLPAKYTDPVGGTSPGKPCEFKCADGAFIKSWKLTTSLLVDSIQGRCSDGNWLTKCGGEGGTLSEVTGDSHTIPVRYRAAALLRLSATARSQNRLQCTPL
jgi:hypothetical protein